MITMQYGNKSTDSVLKFDGLSSDNKPINYFNLNGTTYKVTNGSSFLEMDTGSFYKYSKSNSTWYQL